MSTTRTRPAILCGALLCTLALGCVTTEIKPPADVERQAETRRDVGVDHLSKGRTAMAIRDLRLAADLNPNDYETHLWLGEAYRRRGMLDEAHDHLIQSVALAEGKHRPRITLSALYIQMERYDDAIRESATLVDDPTYAAPWQALTNRGWAEYRLGRGSAARASYEHALEFHPTYWPAC